MRYKENSREWNRLEAASSLITAETGQKIAVYEEFTLKRGYCVTTIGIHESEKDPPTTIVTDKQIAKLTNNNLETWLYTVKELITHVNNIKE